MTAAAKLIRFLLLFVSVVALWSIAGDARADGPRVAVIELHGPVTGGMASFVTEQLDQAWRNGYSGIILDIDTDSGSDAAAEQIKSTILSRASDFPIAAYVHDHALGPGSLIPIACKTIAMSPAASIGGNGGAGAATKADFGATADATGRNHAIATAFVAADNPWPNLGLMTVGSPLTTTTKQAQTVQYCDVVATDYPTILQKMGLQNASIVPIQFDTWTAVARWIAQPWATILLLAIGLALVIIELMTMHSWGIAGIIGAVIVLLIFAAHIAVGNASWIGLILFLIGCFFLLFETHILPGHGVSAMVGLVLITVGMYFALGGSQHGGIYAVAGALMTTVAIMVAFFIYLPKSRIWTKIGQPLKQSASAGYVASEDYTEFLGQIGTTVTLLRPSGTAEFEGIRLPVVSEGDFIPAGTPVQVILVQGNRIVVRANG
jgi:membrane-bound serine protease (ClpP class)